MRRLERLQQLRRSGPVILPSLLRCDFGNLEREVGLLQAAGIEALHLDVMDGNFVPNLTYGMPIVQGLRRLTEMPLDVHLMICNPHKYIDAFCEAGADMITVHVEATDDVAAVLRQIRSRDLVAGVALNPDTPVSELSSTVGECDLVLVMSVNAGFGGQAFDRRALTKLREVRDMFGDDVILEVDGGVNADTVSDCREAGAEFLVVGSAIFRSPNYGESVVALTSAH